MKGVYALIIEIKRNLAVSVGALGILRFDRGDWVYIGSAMGAGSTSIENRLQRHFRSRKAVHWHIDYMLGAGAIPKAAVWGEAKTPIECKLAMLLTSHQSFTQGPLGFGASDCRARCKTHLFLYNDSNPLVHVLETMLRTIHLQPKTLTKDDMPFKDAKT